MGTAGPVLGRRYHSLDQLRAIMMLLGLVIHSAVSFTVDPLGRAWPYQDASTHVFFDIVVFFIHVFRMPLFFLMAGFFAAFLYDRSGARAMLTNRFVRIVVPFTLFLAVLLPLTRAGFTYSLSGGVNGGWAPALAYLSDVSAWYKDPPTIHLWFLYYLILFYGAILLVVPVVSRLTRRWADPLIGALGRLIHHPVGFLACTATTFVTLLPMSYAGLDTETAFLVQPKVLAAYGVFVVFGWLLFRNRDQVDRFADRPWPFMFAGVVLSGAYLAYIVADPPEWILAGKALASIAMWTLIDGFLGLFARYYDRPHPVGRYLSDASCWLYLAHLPITIRVPGWMNGWNVSALVKSGITLLVTVVVTVVTYHFLVRSTVIEVLLNGKRYPRSLPRFDAAGRLVGSHARARG